MRLASKMPRSPRSSQSLRRRSSRKVWAPTIASLRSVDCRRRDTPSVAYRRAGDAYLLIEYGPIVLDFVSASAFTR